MTNQLKQLQIGSFEDYKDLADETRILLFQLYQAAFAGSPWYEVTKCASTNPEVRCKLGFSTLEIGSFCTQCENTLLDEAYPTDELEDKYKQLSQEKDIITYIETQEDGNPQLCAMFWRTNPTDLFIRKYKKNECPAYNYQMSSFLGNIIDGEFLYLDEIFADLQRKPTGNLANFRSMILEAMVESGNSTVCFRTINQGLLNKVRDEFGDLGYIYDPDGPEENPDSRYFVIIRPGF